MVLSSTGKKPTVAPYSGHMLLIVAPKQIIFQKKKTSNQEKIAIIINNKIRTVGNRQFFNARPIEFYEFAYDANLYQNITPKYLKNCQQPIANSVQT